MTSSVLLVDAYGVAQGLLKAALLPVPAQWIVEGGKPSALTCPLKAGMDALVGEAVRISEHNAEYYLVEYKFQCEDDGTRILKRWPLGAEQKGRWQMPWQMPPSAARQVVIISQVTTKRLSVVSFGDWWNAGYETDHRLPLPRQVEQLGAEWDRRHPHGPAFQDDPWVYVIRFAPRDLTIDTILGTISIGEE